MYNHEVYLYMLTLATRCHNVCNSMIDVYRPVTEVTAVSESMLCIIYLCDNISLVRWSLCVMDYIPLNYLGSICVHCTSPQPNLFSFFIHHSYIPCIITFINMYICTYTSQYTLNYIIVCMIFIYMYILCDVFTYIS